MEKPDERGWFAIVRPEGGTNQGKKRSSLIKQALSLVKERVHIGVPRRN